MIYKDNMIRRFKGNPLLGFEPKVVAIRNGQEKEGNPL